MTEVAGLADCSEYSVLRSRNVLAKPCFLSQHRQVISLGILLAATNHHVAGKIFRPQVVTHSGNIASACYIAILSLHFRAEVRHCLR